MPHAVHAPGFATRNPARAVETRLVEGRLQTHARDVGTGALRRVTDGPYGVELSEIEPDGGHIWWFDADSAGQGSWRRQPFAGGATSAALVGAPRGRSYGIAFDGDGSLAAVCVGVDGASRCYVGTPGGRARLLHTAPGHLTLVDMAPDGRLLALAGRPEGPDAVVLCAPGAATVRLPGDPQRRLWPLEFHPETDREPELLLVVERSEGYALATWRASTGLDVCARPVFDSEVSARWYGGGSGVLVQHERAGRSRLLVTDLQLPGSQEEVELPDGTVHDLACAPDGALHCVWSRQSTPPRRLVVRAGESPGPVPEEAGSARRSRRWTRQPYGTVHSFVATPDGDGPWPTLFLLHGGPATHDRDAYDPRVDALTALGYAVVRTNYRGSTGYGARWQHDWGHRVGLAQIEDLAAVRNDLVGAGVALADRTGLCGFSWGGYLTLLALGAQPDLWWVGLAAYPIADYAAAHRATTPALRETDRALFGGTPDEVPERYRAACPTTYVDRVRAPVLLVCSPTDERCPADQVERYAEQLYRRAVPHEVLRVGGGHRSLRTADHVDVLTAMLRFAERARTAPPPDSPGTSRVPGDRRVDERR